MKHERGLAAVTAILIVAVAASTATLMLAQQSAMLDQTMLVATRAQADQYDRAGLDWVRGVLLQDSATTSYDSLDEGWAQPIAALPVERAIVSGFIADEQGKFNINNLVGTTGPSKVDIEAFQRLLVSQGLAPELVEAVIDWIDPNEDLSGPNGAESPYYLSLPRPYRAANMAMMQVEELYRARGFDAAAVRKLRPFITAIPGPNGTFVRTRLNVNTADAVVLAAMLPAMKPEDIQKWIRVRRTKPLKVDTEITGWAGAATSNPADFDVKSSYFMARINVVQDDVELASEALIQRPDKGPPVIIWRRSRY